MNETAPNVALLAPVPLQHLKSGLDVCAKEGCVAFGSRAWQVFDELDKKWNGLPVDVFIYASLANPTGPPAATWHARYRRSVRSIAGKHPDGGRFRPESTKDEDKSGLDAWVVFWEVEGLRELSDGEHIPIDRFIGLDTHKAYKKYFVPEGPLLVEHPPELV